MATHELKTLKPFFEDIISNKKRFELRYNDRGFKVGDTLILREIEMVPDILPEYKPTGWAWILESRLMPPKPFLYTRRKLEVEITYILDYEAASKLVRDDEMTPLSHHWVILGFAGKSNGTA